MRRGGTLVTVRVPDADRTRVEAVMNRYSPMDTAAIGTVHRTRDGSEDRIVATFANAEQARAAQKALIGAGIDNGKMELLDNRSDLDNWTAIKRHAVPDEDTHAYAEGLGRGHSILVIQAAADDHDRVMQVLGRFTCIDIDDHAAQWRKSVRGWS